jgi:hypothetical protein
MKLLGNGFCRGFSVPPQLPEDRRTAPPHKSVGLACCSSPTKFLLPIYFRTILSELYRNM